MARRNEDALFFMVGILTGITLGVLATLLTTPYTGKEVRGKLAERSREIRDRLLELRGQIEETLTQRSGRLKEEAVEKLTLLRKKIDELLDRLETYLA
ncbi:MAG: YtxH domain-containing protein [Thermotogae bacterium]|nr:YtxH domain-containing protein [Thermotogota bacterium]